MKRNIEKIHNGEYDLVIVGGGINGAALAHIASLNKLKVCLLEKGDFASGTSSKSTKLIHGGLRYLENFELSLVRESLRERARQLENYPHLVKPLEFIIPVYESDRRPLWVMRIGVWLYDFLSGEKRIGRHRVLTHEQVKQEAPELKAEGLVGGVSYFDAQMDDARLCLENIIQAAELGAEVANYVEVKSFIKENGRVVGVVARDLIGKSDVVVKARRVVCCLGPWTDELRKKENTHATQKVRTTKGVHIVYKGSLSAKALLITSHEDSRIFFVIPFLGNTLIGTTDTDYQGDLNNVKVEDADIDYLFKEAERVFEGKAFERENILTTFAGLRPLVGESGAPSKVSRKHVIEETYSKVIYVMGGKYTTYWKIAEDCLRYVVKNPVYEVNIIPPIKVGTTKEAEDGSRSDDTSEFGISEATLNHLKSCYGRRYKNVLALIKDDTELAKPICEQSLAIRAQIVYAIKTEMAQTFDDIFIRRLNLDYCGAKENICRSIIQSFLPKTS